MEYFSLEEILEKHPGAFVDTSALFIHNLKIGDAEKKVFENIGEANGSYALDLPKIRTYADSLVNMTE